MNANSLLPQRNVTVKLSEPTAAIRLTSPLLTHASPYPSIRPTFRSPPRQRCNRNLLFFLREQ